MEHSRSCKVAIEEARIHLNISQAFRNWGVSHGGVYVPIDENTPPSPFLSHIDDRDITTPSGIPLTLMNPAYMIRQLQEEFLDYTGIPCRITSLKPIREENKPDDWERAALEALERDSTEVMEFTEINEEPYLRYMVPMIVKESCLKCHGDQGYKDGDIRGGVVVSFPMKRVLEHEQEQIRIYIFTFGLLLLISVTGIIIGVYYFRRRVDQRNRIQNALQESEKRYRNIVESINACLFSTDKRGRFTFVNDGSCNVLGYTQEQLIGKFYLKFVHPDDREGVHKAFTDQLKTGTAATTNEFRYINSNGSTGWLVFVVNPMIDNDEIIGLYGVAQELTERKRIEQMQLIMNRIAGAVHTTEDIDDLYKFIYSELSSILNTDNLYIALYNKEDDTLSFPFSLDEADDIDVCPAGKTLTAKVIKDNKPLLITDLETQELIEKGEIDDIGTASKIWLGVPLSSSEGVIGALVVQSYTDEFAFTEKDMEIMQFVSGQIATAIERKQAEDVIRKSEERFRQVVDNSGEGISIVDINEEIMFCNPAAEIIFGVQPGTLVGKNLKDFYEPEEFKKIRAHTKQHILGKMGSYENEIRRPDGQKRQLFVTVNPSFDDNDKVIGFYGVFRDITDQKRIEQMQLVTYRIADSVNTTKDLSELFDSICRELGSIVDTRNFFIALYDEEKDMITLPLFKDEKDDFAEFPAGKTMTSYVVKNDRPLLATEEVQAKMIENGDIEAFGTLSKVWLGVPLISGGKVTGAVVVQSYEDSNTYNEKDLEILQFVSGQIATAIERKQAEEALHLSEQKYRQLAETAKDVIMALDLEGNLEYINQEGLKLGGYSVDEAYRMNIMDIIPEDQLVFVEEEFSRRAVGQGDINVLEVEIFNKAGIRIPVEVKSSLIHKDNKPTGVLVIARDITERKQAERALKESEERFRELAEMLPLTIFETDLKGNISYLNLFGRQLFGYSENEVENIISFSKLIAPDDDKRVMGNMKKALKGEEREDHEYLTIKKDGSRLPVLAYSSPIISVNEPAGFRGVIIDMTEIKKVEQALRESEEKFRSVIQQSNDCIILLDIETLKVIDANPVFGRLLGYKDEEIKNLNVYDYIAHDKDNITQVVQRVLKDQHVYIGERQYLRKDGSSITMDVSANCITLGERKVLCVVSRDITERKLFEEEQRRLQIQVQETQKLESLGVLAGGIAHDFNNLLAAIIGNASLAQMDISPLSPALESIRQIEKSARHAADLTKQMLAYSGKGKFIVQSIDLSELVTEMLHLLKTSISKKATINIELKDNLPGIEVDVTQIRQVVMNLITNASEALEDKEGVISLVTDVMYCSREYLKSAYLSENLKKGEYVYVEVTDTGCGMDAETIKKIFDPFYTTKFTGRGLGLAAVLGIVRGHNAAVRISSKPGKGTKFTVLFPSTGAPVPKIEIEELKQGEAGQGAGVILVVDDDSNVRQLASKVLKRSGYEVITAIDGREAVDIFRDNSVNIDCVLLDLTMPNMNGEEAFREIKKINKDAVIILVSGYGEDKATEKFAGKGLNGFIQKPYRPKELTDLMSRVLSF
jgi:PAS domain S-box-containing protein